MSDHKKLGDGVMDAWKQGRVVNARELQEIFQLQREVEALTGQLALAVAELEARPTWDDVEHWKGLYRAMKAEFLPEGDT